MSALDEICDFAVERLAGSGVTFAVVAWLPGREGDMAAVAVSSPPAAADQVVEALATACAGLEKQP